LFQHFGKEEILDENTEELNRAAVTQLRCSGAELFPINVFSAKLQTGAYVSLRSLRILGALCG
jgi:hypothetical protein